MTPRVLAGRYKVIDRLGSGGMATVYLAEDERLGRKVAVKRLHSDSPEDAAARFEREAKVGASLSHPNLVTVFDTVADDEGVLIVMEYVEGENLAELMARGRVPAEQGVAIIKAVAGALDHAHEAGVVHRDVKPANILVSPDGKAKLVDLGIATATERTQITAVGTVLGTPSYMAPEQLEGGKISKAVDIYALSAVAFELLAGRKARQGRTPVEIAHQIANDPTPDIREAWSDAPPAAAAVLQRGMSRDPSKRPPSAGQLARSLAEGFEAPLRGTAPSRTSAPPSRRSAPPVQRTRGGLPRWIPVAGLVLVLLVVAGAISALSNGGEDKGTAPVVATKEPAAKKPAATTQPAASQTQTTPSATTPAPTGAGSEAEGARLHDQAFQLANQGNYDQAVALERKALPMLEGSQSLTYWYALYNLGHSLRASGHPDEAIPILQKRLENPDQRAAVEAELKKAQKEAKKG